MSSPSSKSQPKYPFAFDGASSEVLKLKRVNHSNKLTPHVVNDIIASRVFLAGKIARTARDLWLDSKSVPIDSNSKVRSTHPVGLTVRMWTTTGSAKVAMVVTAHLVGKAFDGTFCWRSGGGEEEEGGEDEEDEFGEHDGAWCGWL